MSKANFDCTSCQLGKQSTLPFNNSESISNSIFELIHSDVWGPFLVTSIGRSWYFVVFIDDYSRYSWIFPMKSHPELLPIYNNFAKMVETQFSKRIKIFWSNNALEYTQYAFQALLHSYGTIHHLTCPSTSQQNGRAKQNLRHVLNTIHALLLSAKVPAPFWGEAVFHTVHAINHIPSMSSIIKLHIRAFLGHPLTIITCASSVLPVSFFFNLMSTKTWASIQTLLFPWL